MTKTRVLVGGLMLVIAAALGWVLFIGLPRWYGAPAQAPPPPAPVPSARVDDVRKIKVRLFYLDADGTRLVSVEREVPYEAQAVAQARQIVEAQLAPPSAVGDTTPVSAMPAGTTLRALFVTDTGTAFVDLSREVSSAHPGGTTNELLTIYTVVQALTTNLPAITSVQLLVDGKEVDTLAGHVDIKRPLPRSDDWVTTPAGSTPAVTSAGASTPSSTTTDGSPRTDAR